MGRGAVAQPERIPTLRAKLLRRQLVKLSAESGGKPIAVTHRSATVDAVKLATDLPVYHVDGTSLIEAIERLPKEALECMSL